MSSPTVHETTSPPPQRRGHRRAGHRASHVLEGLHEQAGSPRAAAGAPALARRARRQPRARTGRRWRDRRNTNVPACDAAPARGVRVRACSPLVQPTRWGDTRARAAIQKSVRFPPSRAPRPRRRSPRPHLVAVAAGQEASTKPTACKRPALPGSSARTNQRVENIWVNLLMDTLQCCI